MDAFNHALIVDPDLASAAWNLSDLLFKHQHDLGHADDLLVRALANGLPDAPRHVIERSIRYQRSGHTDRSLKLVEDAVRAKPDDGELRIFRGRYRMDRHDCAAALQDFHIAEQARPDDPIAYASAGLAQMCLGDMAAARESFSRSLQIDPNQPMLRRFFGQ
jgi:Tfp pilus assembly protein PilF